MRTRLKHLVQASFQALWTLFENRLDTVTERSAFDACSGGFWRPPFGLIVASEPLPSGGKHRQIVVNGLQVIDPQASQVSLGGGD
jgi:hypothetical protein